MNCQLTPGGGTAVYHSRRVAGAAVTDRERRRPFSHDTSPPPPPVPAAAQRPRVWKYICIYVLAVLRGNKSTARAGLYRLHSEEVGGAKIKPLCVKGGLAG